MTSEQKLLVEHALAWLARHPGAEIVTIGYDRQDLILEVHEKRGLLVVWERIGEFALHPFLRQGCHPKCAVETVVLPGFKNADGEALVLEVGEVFELIRASPLEGRRTWMIEVFRNSKIEGEQVWRFHFHLDEQESLIPVFATYPPTLTVTLEESPSFIRFAGQEAYVYCAFGQGR